MIDILIGVVAIVAMGGYVQWLAQSWGGWWK